MAGTFNTATGVFTQAGPEDRLGRRRSRARRLSDDELLAAAVADGRIPASRRSHYAAELARRPKATRKLIASLAPGMRPEDSAALAADAGDGTSTDGSWIVPHERSVPGTIFDIAGRTVVAAFGDGPVAPPPVAAPRRPVAADGVDPVATAAPAPRDRVAHSNFSSERNWTSTQPDQPAPHDGRPPKLRPGTILDEHGRVVASA